MKTRKEKIADLIRWFRSNYLKKESKWFAQDVEDYANYIQTKDDTWIDYQHNFRSPENLVLVDKEVDKEIAKLEKAGMFNIGNLSPIHALD